MADARDTAVRNAPNAVHASWRAIETSVAEAGELELTILMPCLNEAETLATCIDKAAAYLARSGVRGEIVVADNGSTDGSQEIARAHGARVVPVASRGYGAALAGGIAAARGRFVIMGDSDDSYDFASLDPFMAELRDGHDLVMGNRFRGGIARRAMPPLHRYLGNPVLSFLGGLFFHSPVADFHCGLRGFSRAAILDLRLDAPGMEFASEMVVKAAVTGLRVTEVPTTLSPDGRSRPPHLRSWRDGWRHLKLLLTFAPDWLFLRPGLALAAAGLLLTLTLLPGPLALFGVTLDNASLIFAVAAVLIGGQMLGFYAVAKTAAVVSGMLPADAADRRMQRWLTVDGLSAAGGASFLLGIGLGAASLVRWSESGFGDLDPSTIVRMAAVATLFAAAGIQAVTTGFLIGLIRRGAIHRRLDAGKADAAFETAAAAPDRNQAAARSAA